MSNITVEVHANVVNNKIKHIKKDWGIFFTPLWVVDFMVNLINENELPQTTKILEPACGICQFLLGIKKIKRQSWHKCKEPSGTRRSFFMCYPCFLL